MHNVPPTVRSVTLPESTSPDHPSIGEQWLSRLPEVLKTVPLSESTILRMVKDKKFPAPVRIGKRAIAWRKRDITEWIEKRNTAGLESPRLPVDAQDGRDE